MEWVPSLLSFLATGKTPVSPTPELNQKVKRFSVGEIFCMGDFKPSVGSNADRYLHAFAARQMLAAHSSRRWLVGVRLGGSQGPCLASSRKSAGRWALALYWFYPNGKRRFSSAMWAERCRLYSPIRHAKSLQQWCLSQTKDCREG